MKKILFTGCATALITPFRDGEVDYEALDRLVDNQIAGGVSALVAAGTTGEPATMTWVEHMNVIRRVVERTNGRVPVIAGTGSNSTQEAIGAAKNAKSVGADAQLVVTPYYNKTTQAGLIAHYRAVADSCDLPMIVYNVPSRTGVNIAPATLQEICRHENVVGVKEANADVGQALEKLRLCGADAAFYSGNDDLAVPLMACGFKGVISVLSNMLPKETSAMAKAAMDGDGKSAAAMQLKYLPLINALFCETSPIPVKAAMAAMGLCGEEIRLPLVPMQAENRRKLYGIMRELGIAMPTLDRK